MRIKWVALCRHMSTTADGTTNLFGVPADLWAVSTLPTVVPVRAAVAISATSYEITDYAMTILRWTAKGPDSETVESWSAEFGSFDAVAESYPEDWDRSTIYPLRFEFTAASEGRYSLEFQLGAGEPMHADLRVVLDRT